MIYANPNTSGAKVAKMISGSHTNPSRGGFSHGRRTLRQLIGRSTTPLAHAVSQVLSKDGAR
jgi:hypothetical protein